MKTSSSIKKHLYKLPILAVCLIMALISLVPFLLPRQANAYGQITARSLTLSSGIPSATGVTYTFTFGIPSTSQVEGLKFIACTNAVGTYPTGTCTPPAGMTVSGDGFTNAAFAGQSGWQGATNFTVDAVGANNCVAAPNVICATRTDTTSQTANTPPPTPTTRTISFNTIKNPSTTVASPNGVAFYVGIYTYTSANWANGTNTDFGATASAVVQTLTANAAVAEVLNFCIGSTSVDDTSTLIATDCSTVAGTSVNIGTLDTSLINISPVAINGGDGNNGVAMVRTNALNGMSVSYDAIQQSGTNHQGTLRINGGTCNTTGDPGADANGNTKTDPCINSAGVAQTTFTAGVEEFGMTVAGVNSGSTTSYACQYGYTTPTPTGSTTPIAAGDSCSLLPATNYLGAGTGRTDADYNTTNGFAWDETGTAQQIATSTTAIDDEALVLKFAATPSITTPFGPYAAQSDYIAVATY
jgi:hypothetical protein